MIQTLYIVDDDKSVLKILTKIVKDQQLGQLVGRADCGRDAIDDLKRLLPDIILLDFLLPDIDGLEIIQSLPDGYTPKIIMISEVSSKEMIAKAYRHGIEFFINKPINVVEVVSVVKKVIEHLTIHEVLTRFEDAFSHLHQRNSNQLIPLQTSMDNDIRKVLGKLGILGESGSDDLIQAIQWLEKNNKTTYRLTDLYCAIVDDPTDKSQVYAVEQRIRRTISKAFNELSERGIEDYSDYLFDRYASLLFDFSEIRKQMNYIRQPTNPTGKINIRKFIEGLYADIC